MKEARLLLLIKRGSEECPKNEDVFIEACMLLENKDVNALIPNSFLLWKAVVNIANEEDARMLLHKAVKFCPHVVELWLALSRICPYAEEKHGLNKAMVKLSKEPEIWINAAKIEEANGNKAMVDTIIQKGITKEFRATYWVITKHIPKRR